MRKAQVATCTVNMLELPGKRNEVCIKDYSENKVWPQPLKRLA